MKKTINPIKFTLRIIFFLLFFIIMLTSKSFAQNFYGETGQDLIVSANILSVAAHINSERMSISYNGLTTSSRYLFYSDRNSYMLESSKSTGEDFEKLDADDYLLKFGKKLKQMHHYFLRYFNVDDFSTDDADSKTLLKSKVDTGKMNPTDFEFNLSLTMGYDNDTIMKMNAIKLKSYWLHTYVNAVYHYDRSELEFDLSSAFINDYLLEGMKLELQANPGTSSGAILITMGL